jgi:aminoglycoside phosphotransferase (APT) family kinase protein
MRAQRAGVRVPTTLADGLVNGDDQQYVWALETWHPGRAFDHDHTDTDAARAAIWDLGQQLRRLHTVTIDAFGDLPPRPYDVYPDFAAWLANKRRRVAAAMQLIAADAALEVAIDRIYAPASWHYTGSPRLCKGDCASDNLLVHDHQVTIIDWEWAQGLDPAADLAYWCRATPDLRAHRLLLEAYAPDDMPIVMRRMQLFNVVHAIETIHVLDEHRHAFSAAQRMAGFAAERRALQRILADS